MCALQVHENFLEVSLWVAISAFYLLFPGTPKNYDMVFIYSTRILVSNKRPSVAKLQNDT